MKRILYTIGIGSLALAFTARAADENNNHFRHKGRAAASTRQSAPAQSSRPRVSQRAMSNSGQVRTQRSFNTARFHQPYGDVSVQANSNARGRGNAFRNNRMRVAGDSERNVRTNRFQNQNGATVRSGNRFRKQSDVTVNRERNLNNRNRDFTNRSRNVNITRERNINRNVVVTNHWQGERFSGQHYAAFRNYHRQWHDRDWWRHNHTRIVFVLGGAYCWDSGYWYPAWGYNPGYYYPYDGPIYGYGSLTPDQVVVNVQAQLQRDGYYDGPVDGVLGPMTRQAIAQFQADHGLAVTSAVDEPTLATLGLV